LNGKQAELPKPEAKTDDKLPFCLT
jgi:hypothetical protein